MEVAPTQPISGFSPASSGAALSFTTSDARRRAYLLVSIVGLALVLRLYGISQYQLGFDEYGSIWEAKLVGLNWNSIIYSSLMHFWVRMGTSELWLRLPAAIFGAATVPIIFKIGEKLGGWRTGVIAGLLAAMSPFDIYHSQEVRFYSLFIFSSAAFMLATISYIDSKRRTRDRLAVLLTGLVLLVSHFLGILGLYAQGTAAIVAAHKRWPLRAVSILVFGIPLLMFGLPVISVFRNELLHLYQVYGNAMGQSLIVTPFSVISFAKMAFAGYIFVFGYHVYPLRLIPVITGLSLSGFLLGRGALRLWKQRQWRVLPFTYLLAVFGVYIVLNSVGRRLATGVSPRHVAFVWPVFVILIALGLSSFTRTIFQVLLVAVLAINAMSLWYGWQKDWTYGVATDFRSAAAYAAQWASKDSALIGDGRSQEAIDFYFPKSIPQVNSSPGSSDYDFSEALSYRHLIVVTNDWRLENRRDSDQLMRHLAGRFTWIDGRVDYPLFEYVLERKPLSESSGYSLNTETGQVRQPLSFYGLEFQDLRLPITVKVKDVTLQVVGAYGLPNSEGSSDVTIPLAQATHAGKLILLTNVVGLNQAQAGQPIAEVVVESKSGAVSRFPLRLDRETASWGTECQSTAECKTVFRWHKRLAIAGQNSFPDAWRDFPAGLHGVRFDLPQGTEAATLKVRYLAGSGHFYIWGVALSA
jgi:hypothetical protein